MKNSVVNFPLGHRQKKIVEWRNRLKKQIFTFILGFTAPGRASLFCAQSRITTRAEQTKTVYQRFPSRGRREKFVVDIYCLTVTDVIAFRAVEKLLSR